MNLSKLPKIVARSNKRVGRGHGSGKGKTAGRGTKGQKARGSIRPGFEGGQLPLIKRLPFTRGKNRNNPFKTRALVINVKYLNLLPKEAVVDADLLIKYRIIKSKDDIIGGIKILGDGELSVPLTVKLPVSGGAKKKIEAAGGKVVETQ